MKRFKMWVVVFSVVLMECTAYTLHECPNRITASGTIPVEGRTVASDELPLGTRVMIWGREYVVEDRFGAGRNVDGTFVKHDCLDIFMNNISDAFEFGRQWVEVTVL